MMTSKQAQEQIEKCEQQIISAYSSFHNEVRILGERASKSAYNSTSNKTLLVLSIPMIIGFIWFVSNWFLGLVCIIGGIIATYYVHDSGKASIDRVVNLQKNLNSQLDNNKII